MLGGIMQSNVTIWTWRCANCWRWANGNRLHRPVVQDRHRRPAREPLVTLAEQLIGKGMQLSIYDPEVHLASLLGANRSFIEKHLPHIGQMMRSGIEEVIAESEVLVIGLSGREVADRLASLCRPEQVLLDLVRLPDPAAIPARVEGLCW
jgi:GDP-mannose 6-dehydrogenase